MAETNWNDIIGGAVGTYLAGFGGPDAFKDEHAYLVETSKLVQERFSPEAIASVEWDELARILNRFDNVKASPGRLLKIFGWTDVDRVRETIKQMLHSREPVDERLISVSGRQLGEGFFGELLCYYRPYQYPMKSTAAVRALARITTVFEPYELKELSYDQWRKFLLPIADVFGKRVTAWLRDPDYFGLYRFLLIYRWLKTSDAGKRGGRRKKS